MNCTPTTSNETRGSFGIAGFDVRCVANYDEARVDLWLASNDTNKNKEAYDLLYEHKDAIESELGVSLGWGRGDDYKASWIVYHLKDVSITNKQDWEKMAQFYAEWSNKICNAVLPYLKARFHGKATVEEYRQSLKLSELSYRWALDCPDIEVEITKCEEYCLRFKTKYMDSLLPAIEGYLGDWKTFSHYYYEIRKKNKNEINIQLAINLTNLPDQQKNTVDKICELFPGGYSDTKWKMPFVTKQYSVQNYSKEEVEQVLNQFLNEVWKFEQSLKDNAI